MFVINSPQMSCCGQARNVCNCGGHAGQAPVDDPDYVYSGRYSKFWTPEKEAERQREEQLANASKPTPMPVMVWNFENEFVPKSQPSAAVVPAATRQEQVMFTGAAFGEAVTNRRSDVPTPMDFPSWEFSNEFSSNRR